MKKVKATMVQNLMGVTYFKIDEDHSVCKVCGVGFSDFDGLEWTFINGIAKCRCYAEYDCFNRDKERHIRPMNPRCLVPEKLIPLYKEAWESSKGDSKKYSKLVKAINKAHQEYDEE